MIVVADAGATKISWAVLNKTDVYEFKTSGYNPNVADSNYLRQLLISGFPSDFLSSEVSEIYYFGAGCGSEFGKERVRKALHAFFSGIKRLKVMTDLEGAGKALFNKKEGVVGILGTGANAGFYDGNAIVNSPLSLGYLLGDEGSGAYFGKNLIPKLIRKELPNTIIENFYETHNLSPAKLIKNIYSHAQPNRYLATFLPFMKDNIQNREIEQIIVGGFEQYYQYFLVNLEASLQKYPLGIVGGVALAFEQQLKNVLSLHGLKECKIIESPLKAILKNLNS